MVRRAGGPVLIGGPWRVAIYFNRYQSYVSVDNGPFASERVPVFEFRLCPGPSVPWGWG